MGKIDIKCIYLILMHSLVELHVLDGISNCRPRLHLIYLKSSNRSVGNRTTK